jgi:hypothetical protein
MIFPIESGGTQGSLINVWLGTIINPHHEPGRVLLYFVRFSKNVSDKPHFRLTIKHFPGQSGKHTGQTMVYRDGTAFLA